MNPNTVQNPDTLPDIERWKLLIAATGIAGGAPVEVFAKLGPGEQLTVEWRGKPVWILRRTEAMLDALEKPGHLIRSRRTRRVRRQSTNP